MNKKIRWTNEYAFVMLDMMDTHTDEDLKELGMSDEKIAEFRKWQEENPPEK